MSMCIWYSAKVLFTCVQVLGHQQEEGVECEMWAVGANSKILGGPEQTGIYLREEVQQEVQSNPGPRKWRTYSQSAPRTQLLKYVQRRSYVIVRMRRTCLYFYVLFTCCHDYLVTHYLSRISELSAILTVVYFHRLRINHDSHKFILESGTVANNYTQFNRQ